MFNTSADYVAARYLSSGSLDSSFGSSGRVTTTFSGNAFNLAYALAIQPDGKIIVGGGASSGSASYFVLARFK